jgi:hypothetical protein
MESNRPNVAVAFYILSPHQTSAQLLVLYSLETALNQKQVQQRAYLHAETKHTDSTGIENHHKEIFLHGVVLLRLDQYRVSRESI